MSYARGNEMSEKLTTEEIANAFECADDDETFSGDVYKVRHKRRERFLEWLAAHDAEVVSVERERLIQDMQDRSHPDSWGVPCIYVSIYAKHLRDET